MTSYCIFQEPWWLDAVAPGAWQSLEVVHGDQIAARMPIVVRRHFGFQVIRNPPLTPTLGPWLRMSAGSAPKRMSLEKELINGLIDQMPRWDYFEVNLHHHITNWLPFYWRGFKQTTHYTYILEETADPDRIWRGLQENVRRNIRKAQRELCVRTDLPLEKLLDLTSLTFRRQGQSLPFARSLVRRIDMACANRGARYMLFAEDSEGRIHSALYVVVDATSAYYLLGGADPQYRNSGAQNFLLWEAIRLASSRGLMFNFEGSMIEAIEKVFRGFGARQVPYLHISGARPVTALLLCALPRGVFRRVGLSV